jgi:hypothetical protein
MEIGGRDHNVKRYGYFHCVITILESFILCDFECMYFFSPTRRGEGLGEFSTLDVGVSVCNAQLV